jgi:hypothetical protein
MAKASELYEQVLSRLKGGGATLKADLADIEAGKKSAIAAGTGRLISGGLGGTTVMGAVPLAAEKTAGRARLRARGGAESKYMTALMSFANLAESSRQQELNRQAGRQGALLGAQTQLQMGGQPVGGTMAAPVRTYGGTYGMSMSDKPGWSLGEYGTLGGTGGGQASQFPSIYGAQTGGGLPTTPNWMGDGGGAGWTPPREYDPSMVGKSLWAQEGSQIQTLEQGTQQAVTAGLPQSAQATTQESFKSTTNYMAMLYNKTGQRVSSQQAAYSALQSA